MATGGTDLAAFRVTAVSRGYVLPTNSVMGATKPTTTDLYPDRSDKYSTPRTNVRADSKAVDLISVQPIDIREINFIQPAE
jgi:hypothetical protein